PVRRQGRHPSLGPSRSWSGSTPHRPQRARSKLTGRSWIRRLPAGRSLAALQGQANVAELKRRRSGRMEWAVKTEKLHFRRLFAALVSVGIVSFSGLALAGNGGSDTSAFQRALEHGAFVALIASYAFGLATSLTPCVYPM